MRIVARTKVFVGMDYHSGSVQVCVMDGQGKVLLNRSYANDWQEIVSAGFTTKDSSTTRAFRCAACTCKWRASIRSGRRKKNS